MSNTKENPAYKVIIISSALTTLVMTPWFNVDALVIPKLIMLFCSALFLLPSLFINFKIFLINPVLKFLLILSILMAFHMILVLITSSAPIEQQIFGKTGRGLGFITEISLIIVLLASARYVEFSKVFLLINSIVISAIISSLYSICQKHGLDLFDWATRTNGIIGTLGNPNFQSSLAAIALVPSFVYFFKRNVKSKVVSLFLLTILFYTIYICQSTQGYLLAIFSFAISTIIFLWYRSRVIFTALCFSSAVSVALVILGTLNVGPLASTLYKYSIKSRGEFFRTALSGAKDNPVFGVGIDSFGDYSTFYKSAKDAAGVNEFTDNAHNYFLNYAVNGGFPLAVLYFTVTVLALISFFKIQKRIGKFDIRLASIFSAWVGFQAQSLVSPGTIPLMLLGSVLNGTLIGLSVSHTDIFKNKSLLQFDLYRPLGYFLILIGMLITYPYFNVDRLQLRSVQTGDGLLGIKSALSYPESSLRYQRIGTKLLESNLGKESLEVGRAAVRFNPNSISAWALILANSTAPIDERKNALNQILRLDPYNTEIRKLEVMLK